jgi:hypothetical protein
MPCRKPGCASADRVVQPLERSVPELQRYHREIECALAPAPSPRRPTTTSTSTKRSADTGDGDGVVVGGLLGHTVSLAPTESAR